MPEERSVQVIDRRKFLIQMGVATATITVAGAGLGRALAVSERESLERELAAIQSRQMPDMPPMIELPNEADPVKPALGTRPEYTAVRDHYQIFIRSQPTVIDGDTWELPITGLVDNPVNLTLSDIRNNYTPRKRVRHPVLHIQPRRRRPDKHDSLDGRERAGRTRRGAPNERRALHDHLFRRRLLRDR